MVNIMAEGTDVKTYVCFFLYLPGNEWALSQASWKRTYSRRFLFFIGLLHLYDKQNETNSMHAA